MSRYVGEVRRRGQNLLIVEGKHEKNELFSLLFRCFPEINISMDNIWIYGTNIYILYEDIVKEYGEDWEGEDIDLPFVISKKNGSEIRYKQDFTNIILVFDYERHDTNFSEEKIVCMQRCFTDSTDMGRLYINYPMIESYQHLRSLPDTDYAERKIAVSLQPGREYKSLVRRETIIKELIEFPHRINDLLEEHYGITDDQKRKECCEQILAVQSDDDIPGQMCEILKGVIEEKRRNTAKYHLGNMIEKIRYAGQKKTYWNYMRDIMGQIIYHNICKANRIQYNQYLIRPDDLRECFERIDFNEILNIQNTSSRNDQTGFIWVLCTCIFIIPDYNFSFLETVS